MDAVEARSIDEKERGRGLSRVGKDPGQCGMFGAAATGGLLDVHQGRGQHGQCGQRRRQPLPDARRPIEDMRESPRRQHGREDDGLDRVIDPGSRRHQGEDDDEDQLDGE